MALPVCSVCHVNEAIMTLTDFSDGTTVTPCVACFPELVEYVVNVMTAIEQAMALPPDEPLTLPDPDETPSDEPQAPAEPEPDPTPPTSKSGRSRQKSDDPPTATDDPVPSEPEGEPVEATN